jgi:hypothetical protein
MGSPWWVLEVALVGALVFVLFWACVVLFVWTITVLEERAVRGPRREREP